MYNSTDLILQVILSVLLMKIKKLKENDFTLLLSRFTLYLSVSAILRGIHMKCQ